MALEGRSEAGSAPDAGARTGRPAREWLNDYRGLIALILLVLLVLGRL